MKAKLGTVALALATVSQCLDPTEIVLDLSTDVACSDVQANGFTVAVGPPGMDTTTAGAPSFGCSDGGLGSLVVVPSGAIDDSVGIRVVLGVDASAASCAPPDFAGCIVARRALHFSPHQPLSLPIALQASCLGQACDPTSTCDQGACVDAGVICTGATCNVEGDAGAVDSGPPDAGGCQNVTVTLAQSPAATTPHIAKTATGYAVTVQTAQNELVLQRLDANGNLNGGAQLLTLLQLGGWGGPIASDGSKIGVTLSPDGASLAVLVADPSPSNPTVFSGVPPVAGGVYDPQKSVFKTLAIAGGTASVVDFDSTLGAITGPASGAKDFTMVQAGARFYVGAIASTSTCVVSNCDGTGCVLATTVIGCDALRMVGFSDGTVDWGKVSGTTLTFRGLFDTIDDPQAFALLPTTPLRVVWHKNGSLVTTDVPATASPVTLLTTALPQPTSNGPGFDVVADGDGLPGWAMVYYQSDANAPTIRFTHRCN